MVPPCSDRISRVPPYSRINRHLHIRGYHPLWPDFPDRSVSFRLTTGLFRVRSPLLAESLLMSVPPGTEMFQFPGFASAHYVFMYGYPCGWVAPFGYPRINACSRLPVAFRSVPRPSSPPGAKASTECPSHTRYGDYDRLPVISTISVHGNHRQIRFRRSQLPLGQQNQSWMIPSSHFSTKYSHNASEPSPSNAGALAVALTDKQPLSRSDMR